MYEDISIWKLRLAVMSVGDTDDRNRVCDWFGCNGFVPGVELPREEDTRLRQELLPRSRPWSMKEFVQTGARLAEQRHG